MYFVSGVTCATGDWFCYVEFPCDDFLSFCKAIFHRSICILAKNLFQFHWPNMLVIIKALKNALDVWWIHSRYEEILIRVCISISAHKPIARFAPDGLAPIDINSFVRFVE